MTILNIHWNAKKMIAVALFILLIMLLVMLGFMSKDNGVVVHVSPLPATYSESESDYDTYVDPEHTEVFETLNEFSSVTVDNFGTVDTFESVNVDISKSNRDLILLSDDNAWSVITNGLFTSYPSGSYTDNESKLKKLYNENMVMITVPVWYWENPKDNTNMNKVSVNKDFAVNASVADLFIDIFNDIYQDPAKPVINIGDSGMGTWVLRGKNHNNNSSLSGHSLGTTIDINPSTGSFKVNGIWYGNGYGHKAMPKSVWEQLPECHDKYHVLYIDCPIVQIFKSYGFVWGGDWTSGTDCMHFSFLGDGKNAREKGQANYYKYN